MKECSPFDNSFVFMKIRDNEDLIDDSEINSKEDN